MRRRTTSKQSEATDAQILRLHSAMAEKLLAEPALISNVRHTIEQRYTAGLLRHSAYIQWHSILDCIDQPELFKAALLDNGERMRKYRRRTVITGILSEDDRQAILQGLM